MGASGRLPSVRFAVSSPNIGPVDELIRLATEAERMGWDAFFLWDHLHLVRALHLDVHDPWVVLGAVAQATERIRLGTLVTPVARRRPWKLAKEIITLDHLSGGRVIIGVGLGYPGDEEFGAFGDVPDDRVRAERLDEGLVVLDAALRGEPIDFHGKHFTVDADLAPRAVQHPRPPIWVAAMQPSRRPLRRAARFEGVVPLGEHGQAAAPKLIVDYLASEPSLGAALDRDDFDLVMSWAPDTDWRDYERAGATWLVDSTWPADDGMADLARRVGQGPPR